MGYADQFIMQQKMVLEECCDCHITFAVTTTFQKARQKDHNSFYCPMGHSQYYSNQSEEEKLRNQLRIEREYKEEYREERDRLKGSLIATKGHQTRLRKRIANGVCPCCKRNFKNLAGHMKSQHPDFVNQD